MAWIVSRLAVWGSFCLGGLKVLQAVNLDLQSAFSFWLMRRMIFGNLAAD